jgi:hypothetical protein
VPCWFFGSVLRLPFMGRRKHAPLSPTVRCSKTSHLPWPMPQVTAAMTQKPPPALGSCAKPDRFVRRLLYPASLVLPWLPRRAAHRLPQQARSRLPCRQIPRASGDLPRSSEFALIAGGWPGCACVHDAPPLIVCAAALNGPQRPHWEWAHAFCFLSTSWGCAIERQPV